MFMKTKEKICRRKSLLWSMLFLLLFGWFLPLLVTNGIMSIMATRESTYPDRSVRDDVHGKGGRDHGAAAGRE